MMREAYLERLLEHGHPVAERELGAERAAELAERARAKFRALAPEAPRFRQMMNERLFVAGVPMLAIYRVLRDEHRMAEEPALALLGEMSERTMRAYLASPLRRTLARLMFDTPVARLTMPLAYAASEPDGFRFEKAAADAPGTTLAFDVRECALVKYLRSQGAPEIVPLICHLDDVMAEPLRRVRLVRTGTIGQGAERCDFRYVRKT